MNSLRISTRRAGLVFAASALAFATMIPALASAAAITERSIDLSSSVANTSGVDYTVNFTAAADAGAVVVDFCSNSPSIGTACTAPTGFSLTSATTGGGFTKNGSSTASKLIVTGTIDVSDEDEISIPITGVANPTSAGPLYARIITYTDSVGALAYDSSNVNANNPGTHIDEGAVALQITSGFVVSGAVAETLAFCASGANTIATGCTSGITSPNLSLGTNGVLDLAASEGTIYTQLSTNAVGGAVVSLKSNAVGGGLIRPGAVTSDITPISDTPVASLTNGAAKFGLKLASPTGVAPVGVYSASTYYLGAAVTSTYGDAIYDVGTPVSDGTAGLTFAANISNTTPAGNYSAALNLIATGKF